MKKYGGVISKPIRGYNEYKKMVIYSAIKNIVDFFKLDENSILEVVIGKINDLLDEEYPLKWWNVGGQLISDNDLAILKEDIKSKKLDSWDQIHKRYNILWENYPKEKLKYGLYALSVVLDRDLKELKKEEWIELLQKSQKTNNDILINSFESRKKDYTDPFRKMNLKMKRRCTLCWDPSKMIFGRSKNNDIFNKIINSLIK